MCQGGDFTKNDGTGGLFCFFIVTYYGVSQWVWKYLFNWCFAFFYFRKVNIRQEVWRWKLCLETYWTRYYPICWHPVYVKCEQPFFLLIISLSLYFLLLLRDSFNGKFWSKFEWISIFYMHRKDWMVILSFISVLQVHRIYSPDICILQLFTRVWFLKYEYTIFQHYTL